MQDGQKAVEAVDPDVARAACAAILAGFFVTRTLKNFSPQWNQNLKTGKTKTQ